MNSIKQKVFDFENKLVELNKKNGWGMKFMYVATVLVFATLLATYFRFAFKADYSVRYNMFVLLPFLACMVGTGYLLWLVRAGKRLFYEKLYVILALLFSISMQIAMPPFSGPDELVQFLSSYNASNVMTGNFRDYDSTWMRIEDSEFFDYDVRFPADYEMLADGNWFGVRPGGEENFVMDVTWMWWYRFLYTGSGITVARWLGLGNVGLLYLGRFFNSLAMIFIGWLCVKLTPYGKAQIIGFTMFPLTMELCSSYSYDINSIMMSLLFAVLCLHYAEENTRFRFVDAVLLGLILLDLLPNKSVYLAFGFLVFLIPWSKWKKFFWDKEKKLVFNCINLGLIVSCGAVAAVLIKKMLRDYPLIWMIKDQLDKTDYNIEQTGDRMAFSTAYMREYPWAAPKLLLNTWRLYGWTDFKYAVGQYLGHHSMAFRIPTILIVGIIVASVAALFVGRHQGGKGVGKRKFITWTVVMIITLAAMYLGCLLRFTPIEGTDRVQVSYRYYIPVILIGYLMTGTDRKENKDTLVVLWLESLCYAGTIAYIMYHLLTI